jgi:hypothetical protein
MSFDPISIFGLAFVVWFLYKAGTYYLGDRPRNLWKGSEPITDLQLLALYKEIWWETYAVIAPEHRVNHEPTPHWWIYKDAAIIPGGYIGWWSKDQRAVFVTKASKTNRQLIRHECAHDIMNSIEHPSAYFQSHTYVMQQFK